jgi:hypothetical protein
VASPLILYTCGEVGVEVEVTVVGVAAVVILDPGPFGTVDLACLGEGVSLSRGDISGVCNGRSPIKMLKSVRAIPRCTDMRNTK